MEEFTDLMKIAMDECAPMKRFKINTNYKHGLTKEIKELTRETGKLRKSIMKSSPRTEETYRQC